MQKQKQQYGPAAGGAVDLSPELEAAYQQFGRALGEAPKETARIVQAKLGQEQQQTGQRSAPQAAARQSRSPPHRCATEQACRSSGAREIWKSWKICSRRNAARETIQCQHYFEAAAASVKGVFQYELGASFANRLRQHCALPCRQLDEASYKKLEKLFDMAMSDPLNDQEAQPRALIRAKNKVRSKRSSRKHHRSPSHCQEDQ